MSSKRIAVFARSYREYSYGQFRPERLFKYIGTGDDVRGEEFQGIILLEAWYNNDPKKGEALDIIKRRQPELFKNK